MPKLAYVESVWMDLRTRITLIDLTVFIVLSGTTHCLWNTLSKSKFGFSLL